MGFKMIIKNTKSILRLCFRKKLCARLNFGVSTNFTEFVKSIYFLYGFKQLLLNKLILCVGISDCQTLHQNYDTYLITNKDFTRQPKLFFFFNTYICFKCKRNSLSSSLPSRYICFHLLVFQYTNI